MRLIFRFFAFLFAGASFVGLFAAGAFAFVIWKFSQDLPDHAQLQNYEPPVMTRVHAGDGGLLAEYAKERRLYLPIQAMPRLLISAYLSAEDKNFYTHNGIDPEGIARAVVTNFRNRGSRQQGASTITQQVAKNFLLSGEQSYERKIREALIALKLESTFSKDKILELYLNEIYLGLGNYGVAAAALNYFGKSLHELTLPEAAYMAALPKGPNNYHPFEKRDAAITRRNWVIDRMVDNGFVSRADGEKAKAEPLTVSLRAVSPNLLNAGFFAEEVRREIAERYGSKKLYEGGLSVRTTLDPKLQIMARKALMDGLVRYDEARGWRGTDKRISPSGDWGAALAAEPLYNDVQPWRFAVVLDVNDQQARIGIQPRRLPGGQIERERVVGVIPAENARWTRKRLTQTLSPGDVIYAEPTDKPGQFRLRQFPEVSGAMVVLDPHTGRILAMVGGFSFDQSEFNRATQAMRQPGSSFKPFVYATALDNGYTPSSIVVDEPFELDQGGSLGIWRPENYGGDFAGPRTLRYGIEQSRNLMTIRLARDVGMPLIAEYSKRFGIYDDLLPVLAMALGAGETTVLRMTAAYGMLANGGRRIKPTLIDRIQDRYGATIFKHDERNCEGCQADRWADQDEPSLIDRRERVIDPMSAYQITSMMEGVVQRGTATVVKAVGKTLAGKTGTTNEAKDVWFVGYSADLAVGVFMGYDKPRSLGDSATAGQYAAPIFRDFMIAALKDKPDVKFRVPPQMKLVRVNRATGLRVGPGEDAIIEAFKPGTGPPDTFVNPSTVGRTGGAAGAITSGTGGLY
ncbi:MAG: penicillin-binding protein 1A [Methylocystis sp.]|nr:penicillin-binding protein 1A [Methylocystis sp.]MCA3584795.1 penicillin-binding protein 1A [Methylocystis sp.]MCA3593232.1 penicillin-binding protein 1A [Methylocystis sp.]